MLAGSRGVRADRHCEKLEVLAYEARSRAKQVSPPELRHLFLSTLNLPSVWWKAFLKLSEEKRFVIPSTRQAGLFFPDSCKICLLRQIICFLPLRFLYKHTNKEIFWKSYSLSLREEQVLSIPKLHWIRQTARKHTVTTEKQKVGWMVSYTYLL